MKKILLATLILSSLAAISQDSLQAKIVNKRTGESIGIKCLEFKNEECSLFQYVASNSVDGEYYKITEAISSQAITNLLDQQKYKEIDPDNMFDSRRLLWLSETSEVGFSLLDNGVNSGMRGGLTGELASDMYERGDYQSDGSYLLQATGATVAMVPFSGLGLLGTGVFLAVDVAIMPIRLIGKAFKNNNYVKGRTRRGLKKAKKLNKSLLKENKTIYLNSSVWKRVYDGLSDLDFNIAIVALKH